MATPTLMELCLFKKSKNSDRVVFVNGSTCDFAEPWCVIESGEGGPEDPRVRYYCPVCNKMFSKKETVKVHIRNVHGTFQGSVRCDICNTTFKNPDSLRCHNRRYHNNPK